MWTLFVSFIFFSLPYNEVVSVFNRHGPRQRRTTKTDSQHWNNKRYRNIQCSIYRQWRTMAFGKGQTWPEEGQRLLNNTQRTQRSPSPTFPLCNTGRRQREPSHTNSCQVPPAGRWIIKLSKFYIYKICQRNFLWELNLCMRKCRKKCA